MGNEKKKSQHDPRGKKLTWNASANKVIRMINDALDKLTERSQLVELAPLIGISRQHLTNIYNEQCKMPIEPLRKLCHQLGIGVEDGNIIIDLYLAQPRPEKKRIE